MGDARWMGQGSASLIDLERWSAAAARAELKEPAESGEPWEARLRRWFEQERSWGYGSFSNLGLKTRDDSRLQWAPCLADPFGWALSRDRPGLLIRALLTAAGSSEMAAAMGASPKRLTEALFALASRRHWRGEEPSEMATAAGIAAALRLGADANALSAQGDRPLTACLKRVRADRGSLCSARVLAQACDPALSGCNGQSALSMACSLRPDARCRFPDERDALGLCQDLVQRGADVNEPGFRGQGPLRQAALAGNGALCFWLDSQGADFDAVCIFGHTVEEALERSCAKPGESAREAVRAIRERREMEAAVARAAGSPEPGRASGRSAL